MNPRSSESPSAAAAGPLAGVVVVDLTRVLAGPFATMVLHDLGARVIKVERAGVGDDARHIGPFIGERSAYFTSLNCGKESIALDLDVAEDREVLDRLLARAGRGGRELPPGHDGQARLRLGRAPRATSTTDLRRGVRLRSHRPVLTTPRVRHGRAGHGRGDEHHRRRRRRCRRGSARRSATSPPGCSWPRV